MKKSLLRMVQITPKIWAMLLVESVIASFLYSILNEVGLSKSTSFFITSSIAFVLVVLSVLLLHKSLFLLKHDEEILMPKLSVTSPTLEGNKGQKTEVNTSYAVKKNTEPKKKRSSIRSSKPLEIFLAYSHKDQILANMLVSRLQTLERKAQIQIWSDVNLRPGMNWKEEIDNHLMTSDIVLLLVSPDFMASDYAHSEMISALELSRQKKVSIIPILLRSTSWEDTPLHRFQSLPANGKPVVNPSGHDIDDALSSVASSVQKTVNQILSQEHKRRWRERLGKA